MIGVFNEKALLVSRLMKISMIVLLMGVYFLAKASTETIPTNETSENKVVIVNSEI